MISMQDATLRRAQDFTRDRGWRCEPLRWEEVQVLVELTFDPDRADYHLGYDEGFEAGQDRGHELGVEDGLAEGIDLERVEDWCADNGYTLVKAVES